MTSRRDGEKIFYLDEYEDLVVPWRLVHEGLLSFDWTTLLNVIILYWHDDIWRNSEFY